ncbi:hypothetical protein ACRS6B_23645 [Nocardia asteroides]
MLYVIIAVIVVALLAGSAAAMVWDPRRRAELGEYEYDIDDHDGTSGEYARQRSVEWPRKESV